MESKTSLVDTLEEIFEEISSSNVDNSLELFKEGDLTLRTDLIQKEVILLNALSVDNHILRNQLFLGPDEECIFDVFIRSFKRHKISLDRKSRSEFVNINLKNTLDRDLARVSNLKSLTDSRN